jgi:hypothetical protein
MKIKHLLVGLLLCMTSCALFNKTSKTNSVAKQSSINQLESSQLVLKSIDKETQIFTYWNDSGFYRLEQIRERTDQAESDNLKKIDKQQAKQTIVTKKTEPLNTWIFVLIITIVAVWFFYKKVSG